MVHTPRSEAQLNLNLSNMSSNIDSPNTSTKSPFNGPKSTAAGLGNLSSARVGAGSPLHEQTSRLFPKRTRELQSTTGLSPNIWGPPTSGTSTPLFEIPESPSQDGFPDLVPLAESGISSPSRRARAGTLPSRISPLGTINGVNIQPLTSKTSRPTPSTSPFRPGSTSAVESAFYGSSAGSNGNASNSALLSRLRSGSTPQRSSFLGQSNNYGTSPFSSSWSSRARAATLTSINSSEDPASPQQPGFTRDNMMDSGVRTLDYLGLADTPQQVRTESIRHSDPSAAEHPLSGLPDSLSNFNLRNANRFRSFSVNTQPKYAGESAENIPSGMSMFPSGALTPSAAAALEAEYELVQEKVRLHNQAVQAFAVNASAARPRARTAGLVETPQRTTMRTFVQSNGQENSPTESETHMMNGNMSDDFVDSVHGLSLVDGSRQSLEPFDETDTQASRSLWIGSIPNSTTMSSLDAIFSRYGPIESTRVLTHKNCGFVNFETIEHAVRARQILNGREIFPGAGPVRIGFAKAPTASVSMTPNQNTLPPSPNGNDKNIAITPISNDDVSAGQSFNTHASGLSIMPRLADLRSDILQIVQDFGAQQADTSTIAANVESAIRYQHYEKEIPAVAEPSPNRIYDAPRLRDIRKRIDNGACALEEIEQIAIEMLPEIAELASDYLGNTVVQKLFEYCSEDVKEQMLMHITPRLAEIGVHKNGTWAAQKIIEVCKTEAQMQVIVDNIRPYTVPLFLDQYGNYVLQCCLKFGAPYNDFIFETMLSQLWEIAQGRFGSRAMRACLEAHQATKNQQRLLAAVIVLYSVQLATNANGALLLTWLLDTCNFPKRRSVLAPRLVPRLVHLCTHKVAYLTVLKVINQRNEPEARDTILQALFFSSGDEVLEQILRDQTSGVTLIFKILTTPFLDDAIRPEVVRNVSKVLTKIKAQPNQGYKRLMDEVGLSSRQNQPAPQHFPNHVSASNDRSRHVHQPVTSGQQSQGYQRQYSGNFMSPVASGGYENGPSPIRTGSADSFGYSQFPVNGYAPQQSFTQMQYQQMAPQPQYQQNYNQQRPHNGAYMANGFTGYTNQASSLDPFRMQNQSASPLPFNAQMSPVMNSGGFVPQSFQQNVPNNMYSYPQQQYFFSPPMQPIHAAGRGRRQR